MELNSSPAATSRRPMPPRDQSNVRQKRDPSNEDAIGDSIRFKPSSTAPGTMTHLRLRSLSPLSMYAHHRTILLRPLVGPQQFRSFGHPPDLTTPLESILCRPLSESPSAGLINIVRNQESGASAS